MAIETHSSPTPGRAAGAAALRVRSRSAGGTVPRSGRPGDTVVEAPSPRILGVLAIAVIASLVLATQAFGAKDSAYRTATVAQHPVDARLNGVATIEPVSQASVTFPASGTVATVDVAVGDTVAAGQSLATLDPEALTQSLHEAEASRAQAELALSQALSGEPVTGTGASGSNGGRDNPIQLTAASVPGPANPTGSPPTARRTTPARGARRATGRRRGPRRRHGGPRRREHGLRGGRRGDERSDRADDGRADGLPDGHERRAHRAAGRECRPDASGRGLAHARRVARRAGRREAADDSATGNTDGSTAGGPTNGSSARPRPRQSPSAADLVAYQKAVDAAAAEVAVGRAGNRAGDDRQSDRRHRGSRQPGGR